MLFDTARTGKISLARVVIYIVSLPTSVLYLHGEDPAVQALRNCLAGSSPTCSLPVGTNLLVDSAIQINRAVEIYGQGKANTQLKRNALFSVYQGGATLQVNASGVAIHDLAVDGNRESFACQGQVSDYAEISVASFGNASAWLYNLDVSNGPGDGIVIMGSPTTVSSSTLDYNTSTGIWIGADSAQVFGNTVSHSGTAGISINSTNAEVTYNTLFSNRMQWTGGQLWLSGNVAGSLVAGNLIDGNYSFNATGTPVKGCPVDVSGGPVYSGGVEGENPVGSAAAPVIIQNNEVRFNYGDGMSFYASSYITVSGSRYNLEQRTSIHDNGAIGIKFWKGDPQNPTYNLGVMLDRVDAQSNGSYGVFIENASGAGFVTFSGVQSDSCLVSNGGGTVQLGNSVSLTYPFPTNTTSCN